MWADRRSLAVVGGRLLHPAYMRIGLQGPCQAVALHQVPRTEQSCLKKGRNLKINISSHLSCVYHQVEILSLSAVQVLEAV